MTDRIEVAPGVLRQQSYTRAIYTGTAEALGAAGLLQPHQLPGQPGNPRGMCTFDPEGDRVTKGGNSRARCGPGHTRIVARAGVYDVEVRLSTQRLEAVEAERVQVAKCWPFPTINGMAAGAALTCRPAAFQQEVRA